MEEEKKNNRKQRRAAAKQQRQQLKKFKKQLETKAQRAFHKIKKQQAISSEEAAQEYTFG